MEKQSGSEGKAGPKRRRWKLALALLGLLVAGAVGFGARDGGILSGPVAELGRAAQALWAQIASATGTGDRAAGSVPGDPESTSATTPGSSASLANQGLVGGTLYPAGPGLAGPEPVLSISGSVLDDMGKLLPGITVSARRVSGGAPVQGQASALTALTKVSDELGMFKFSPIDPGEYELAAAGSAAYGPAHTRVRSGTSSAELRLQRLRSVRISGIVSSAGKQPLADVRVRLIGGGATTTSSRSGAYALLARIEKAGQVPVLRFEHQGYRDLQKRVEAALAPNAKEVQVDVQMESAGTRAPFSGRVTDSNGTPVAGASLWLSSSSPKSFHSVSSNRQGAYAFNDVEIGFAYRLGVDAGGYASQVSDPFDVGPAGEKRDIVLKPKAYSSLAGQVVTSQGLPMPALNLWLRATDGGSDPPRSFITDASGQFALDRVPVGTLMLETHSQPQLQASGIVLKAGLASRVVVPLDWGKLWLMGRVVDSRGANVPNARATLQWSAQVGGLLSSSRRTASTDHEGYFNFANLGPGEHVLSMQAPGFTTSTSRHDPRQATQELRITLSSLAKDAAGSTGQ